MERIFQGENRGNQQQMLKMLADGYVNVLTSTSIAEIKDGGATINHDGKQEDLEADTIVVAVGLEAKSKLHDELKATVRQLYAIGDCVKPRRVLDAIWEGFRIARLV